MIPMLPLPMIWCVNSGVQFASGMSDLCTSELSNFQVLIGFVLFISLLSSPPQIHSSSACISLSHPHTLFFYFILFLAFCHTRPHNRFFLTTSFQITSEIELSLPGVHVQLRGCRSEIVRVPAMDQRTWGEKYSIIFELGSMGRWAGGQVNCDKIEAL